MGGGTIDIKLRPLKLAFLVDPNEKKAVLEAIKISTSLWGGVYNPIIPVFSKIPKTWMKTHLFFRFNSKKIFEGYIEAYDPDFIVPLGRCRDKKFEVGNRKIIAATEILSEIKEDGTPKYGVGVFEVLNDFISKELKYKRRRPLNIYLFLLPRELRIFFASIFGLLPNDLHKIIEKHWATALEAEKEKITPSNYATFLMGNKLYIRRLMQHGIERTRYGGIRGGECLFYLNAANIWDVIDYWNLRAIGWTVLPIAKQSAGSDATKKMAIDFIKEHSGQSRYNKDIYIHCTVLKARSVKDDEVKQFIDSLDIPKDESARGSRVVFQHWYPRIWDEWARDKDGVDVCELEAKATSKDFTDCKNDLFFKTLDPDQIFRFGGHGTPRFANEINIRNYCNDDIYAEVIPEAGKKLTRTLGGFSLNDWKFSKREAVYFPQHTNWSVHMPVPKAEDVFKSWIEDKGKDIWLSQSGKIAKQMAKRMGGRYGINLLVNNELIQLLHDMEDGKPMNKDAFMSRIAKVASTEKYKTDPHQFLKRCMDVEMFKLGVQVQCPSCAHFTWCTIRDLDYRLQCSSCSDYFDIPSHSPSEIQWSYKAFGVFSANKDHRVYTTLLTWRIFSQIFDGETTPMMSFFTLNNDTKKEIEIDLGMLFRESRFNRNADARPVFVECKSNNDFEKKDVDAMSYLAKLFPGAVIVFATLKDDLKEKEKRIIRPLVNRGRRYWKAEQPYNPVLILTKTELFADMGLQYAWEDAGGKYQEFGKRYFYSDKLIHTCDATQQLYLGLKPWHDWLEEKRKQRNRKEVVEKPSPEGA